MTPREKRCEDCICLISKNGVMCCDEKWGKPCNDIDDCPENIECVDVEKAQSVPKVKHNAQADKPRKKSTRDRKVDTEKLAILTMVAETLAENGYSAEIEKEIAIHFGNYTLKLTRHRPPK